MRRAVPLVALCALAALAIPAGAGGNKYANADWVTHECKDDDGVLRGTVSAEGPSKLWPPNHKFIDIKFFGDSVDRNDGVSLQTGGEVTDIAGGDGGPNHDPDVSPAVRKVTDPQGDNNNNNNDNPNDPSDDPTVDEDPDTDAGPDLQTANDDVILNPDPDGEGRVTNTHGTRSERSGKNRDGRTYTYRWTITLTDNNPNGYGTVTCQSHDEVQNQDGTTTPATHYYQTVPHDMRNK